MNRFYLLLILLFSLLSVFAQKEEDTTDERFHDILLNNLVGKWTASGIVHGQAFQNLNLEAGWIMNHQYLKIHEQGTDTISWFKMPWEAMFLIGYNHNDKRYVVYEFNIRGIDVPYEGFSYAGRIGNELKITSKMNSNEIINQYFIWEPSLGSWHFLTKLEKDGKEGEPYLDLKVKRIE